MTVKRTEVLGKPIRFLATSTFNEKYGGLELIAYIRAVMEILPKAPVDMIEFSYDGGLEIQQATNKGYYLDGREYTDDTEILHGAILWACESLPTDTFWCKIDDYGNEYIGTFLFPEEY